MARWRVQLWEEKATRCKDNIYCWKPRAVFSKQFKVIQKPFWLVDVRDREVRARPCQNRQLVIEVLKQAWTTGARFNSGYLSAMWGNKCGFCFHLEQKSSLARTGRFLQTRNRVRISNFLSQNIRISGVLFFVCLAWWIRGSRAQECGNLFQTEVGFSLA